MYKLRTILLFICPRPLSLALHLCHGPCLPFWISILILPCLVINFHLIFLSLFLHQLSLRFLFPLQFNHCQCMPFSPSFFMIQLLFLFHFYNHLPVILQLFCLCVLRILISHCHFLFFHLAIKLIFPTLFSRILIRISQELFFGTRLHIQHTSHFLVLIRLYRISRSNSIMIFLHSSFFLVRISSTLFPLHHCSIFHAFPVPIFPRAFLTITTRLQR